MFKKIILSVSLSGFVFCANSLFAAKPLRIGLVADCQYQDKPARGLRHYSKSLKKLDEAISNLNNSKLDFSVQVGDLIDADFKSYDKILPIFHNLSNPLYHVLGNHDFSVKDDEKSKVLEKIGLKKRYYDFKNNGWRFVVVDGNDMSLYAWPKNSENHRKSEEFYKKLPKPQPTYNGGIGAVQQEWLRKTLQKAEKNEEKVIILNHFPLLPKEHHSLWNTDQIVSLLEEFSCVKAHINGHNHHGNYQKKSGIHYITLKGMVDTEDNSYAIMELSDKKLKITGFGREKNKVYELR